MIGKMGDKVLVSDNLISHHNQLMIKDIMLDAFFPWYYNHSTAISHYVKDQKHQWTHTFYKNGKVVSSYYDEIVKYVPLQEFKTHELIRIKANLNTPYKKKMKFRHQDSEYDGEISYLYYVTDSDGITELYHNWWKTQKIKPKQGRLVRFPSEMWHSGACPHKYEHRVVINFMFRPFK